MFQLIGHTGPVFSTSFNPDNSYLLSGSEDGTGLHAKICFMHSIYIVHVLYLIFSSAVESANLHCSGVLQRAQLTCVECGVWVCM